MSTGRRLALGAGAALFGGALLAGCATGSTSGTGLSQTPAGPTSPSAVTAVTAPSSVPPAPDTSAPAATTPPAGRTSSGARRSTTAPAGDACTDLTIRVLPGGATPGREIAAVTFANASPSTCTISGYPSVTLLRNGKELVSATPASGTVAAPVRLKPGAQAQARLVDHSTCQAPLSDTIDVTAPNGAGSGQLTRPFQLRGCSVEIDPVKPAS